MQHPALIKKFNDWEYERRHNRFFLIHLMTLMPLLCLGALCWGELGAQMLRWIPPVVCVYLAQVAALETLARREIVASMRREGLVDEDYSPPLF